MIKVPFVHGNVRAVVDASGTVSALIITTLSGIHTTLAHHKLQCRPMQQRMGMNVRRIEGFAPPGNNAVLRQENAAWPQQMRRTNIKHYTNPFAGEDVKARQT